MSERPPPIVLHSTWRGIATSLLSPVLLVALAVYAMVRAGRLAPVAVVIGCVGAVLLLVALLDYPWRAILSPGGITRWSPLRRHRLGWDDVEALRRAPGPILRRWDREGDRRPMAIGLGGLCACRGRRRYLLINTVESRQEFDTLRAAVDEWAPHVGLGVDPPPANAPPTWLYHRH